MAAESHGDVQLLLDDLQGAGHARLAKRTQAVKKAASNQRALRAQSTGFEHILPAANAAIHPHLDVLAHRFGNVRQCSNGGRRPIELAAAVVAHDECIGTAVDGQARVFGVHDALEDQLAAPAFLDPLHITPVELRVELLRRPRRQR